MPRPKSKRYGDGSTYRYKDRWACKFRAGERDGKPYYKVVYGKTKIEAEANRSAYKKTMAKLEEKQAESYHFTSVAAESTVMSYIQAWIEDVEATHLKTKSFDRKVSTIKNDIVPYWGGQDESMYIVGAITTADVQDYINYLLRKGRSLSSIRKAWQILNGVYKWGLSQTPPEVQFNPCAGVRMPTKKNLPPKAIQYYTAEEAAKVCSVAYARWSNNKRIYRLGGAVELLCNTGLRLGEVLALEWADVDFESKKLHVTKSWVHVHDRKPGQTTINLGTARDEIFAGTDQEAVEPGWKYELQTNLKTEEGARVIPLNAGAIHALKDLQQYTGDYTYVLSTEDGDPVRERAFDRMLVAIATRAGMPENKRLTAHPLRHTFATLFLYGGGKGKRGDVKLLSAILGHKDVAVTYNTYTHLLKDLAAEDIEQMPAVVAATPADTQQQVETIHLIT